MRINGLGTFVIREGREIVIHPAPVLDYDMIRIIVINSLLAIVLYQQGKLVLHVSAVRTDRGAVCFIGPSGAGKSLLAAACCARGHELITEDVAAVLLSCEKSYVYPGYPMIKMKRNESDMLGFPRDCTEVLHVRERKFGCHMTDQFSRLPCPIRGIFVLSVGAERAVTRLSAKAAFTELISNSPPLIWNVLPDQKHFSAVGDLIEDVPVMRLTREECLTALPDHAEMVEDFLSRELGVTPSGYCGSGSLREDERNAPMNVPEKPRIVEDLVLREVADETAALGSRTGECPFRGRGRP